MRIGIVVGVVVVGIGAACALACKPGGETSAVEKGKLAYVANCIACHNADPTKDGTIGPAIAGSSLALVARACCRPSIRPATRPSATADLMPAQPFLSADVPDLAAYLGSFAPSGE